jgi:hypothetical protein
MNSYNNAITINKITISDLAATIDLAADQNDFLLDNIGMVRLSTALSNVNITGIVSSGVIGEMITISNNSAGGTNTITLKHQDTNSAASNRFWNLGDDIVLLPGEQVTLIWRIAVNNLARWGVFSVTRSTRKFIGTTPALITTDQNDFPTTGYDVLRLLANTPVTISGFANGTRGKMLIAMNVGTANINIPHQSTLSSTGNRCINGSSGATITILPNDSVTYLYDATDSRWRLIGKSF